MIWKILCFGFAAVIAVDIIAWAIKKIKKAKKDSDVSNS